jgi:hypothetical protein
VSLSTLPVANADTFTVQIGTLTVTNKDTQYVWGKFYVTNVSVPYATTSNGFIASSYSSLFFVITEENYTYTNYQIKFTVRINGNSISSPFSYSISDSQKNINQLLYTFSAEGFYNITIGDIHTPAAHGREQYNYASLSTTVIYDKTAPKISTNKLYYKNDEVITISSIDKNLFRVEMDGVLKTSSETYNLNSNNVNNGIHTLKAYDKAGNTATTTFVVDKLAPSLDLKSSVTNASFASGSTVSGLVYLASDEDVVIQFFKKIGSSYHEDTGWKSFKPTTIYYDAREINFSKGLYSHNIFYSKADALAYVKKKEVSQLKTQSSFSTLPAGYEFANSTETNAAGAGKTYYVYTKISVSGSTQSLVFFDQARATTFINLTADTFVASGNNYFWADGDWLVRATDIAGNNIEKYFVLDNSKPVGRITSKTTTSDGQLYSNTSITYEATDETSGVSKISYRKDGGDWQTISKSTVTISATSANNCKWEFFATDSAGNASSYSTIIMDTTSIGLSITTPNGNLANYFRADQNIPVTLASSKFSSFMLDNKNVSLSGTSYTLSGTTLANLAEGAHTFSVVNYAGTTSTITFYIDRTAPVVTFDDKKIYSHGILTIGVSELNLRYLYFNGSLISNTTTTIEAYTLADGEYSLIACDKAGNTTEVFVLIDRSPPVFYVNYYYKKSDTIVIDYDGADYAYTMIDDVKIMAPAKSVLATTLADGPHSVTVFDKTGNRSVSRVFIIDSINPVLNVSNNIKSGDYVRYSSIDLDVVDENFFSFYWTYSSSSLIPCNIQNATKNYDTSTHMLFGNSSQAYPDGWYSILAVDGAGNSSPLLNIYLDRTSPIFNVLRHDNSAPILDGSKSNSWIYFDVVEKTDVYYSFSKFLYGEYIRISDWDSFKSAPIYFDKRNYNPLTNQTHSIFYTEEAANLSIIETEKRYVASNSNWRIEDGYTVLSSESTYAMQGASYYTYRYRALDGTITNYAFFDLNRLYSYITDTVAPRFLDSYSTNCFWEDGDWEIKVYDLAGNYSTKHIYLDTTPPEIRVSTQVFGENKTVYGSNDTLIITLTDLYIDEVLLNDERLLTLTIPINTLPTGKHEIIALDYAGNKSSLFFWVDVDDPIISMNKDPYSDSKYYYKGQENLTLNITEENLAFVKLDNTIISAWSNLLVNTQNFSAGTHIFSVYDKAGNTSYLFFVVDYTLPYLSLTKTLFNATDTIKVEIEELFLADFLIDNISKGELREFSTTSFTDGSHTLKAIDLSGNYTEIVISIDKTPPVLTIAEAFSLNSTVDFTITESSSYTVIMDYGLSTQMTVTNNKIQFAVPANYQGTHTLMVTDLAGNIIEKTFYYGTVAPTVYLIKNGIRYSSNTILYLKAGDTLSINVEPTYYSYAYQNESSITLDFDHTANEYSKSFDIASMADNIYLIEIWNNNNEHTNTVFYVDKTAPVINKMSYGGKNVGDGFFATAEKQLDINVSDENIISHLFLNGYRENIKKASWSLLTSTTSIEEGTYSYTLFDLAGNSTSFSFIVDKTAPLVSFTKNGVEASSGFYAKQSDTLNVVYNDTYLSTITFDELLFSGVNNFNQLTDGTHIFKVTDLAGNLTTFNFIIDSVAPLITIRKNGQAVPDGSWLGAHTSIYFYTDESPIGTSFPCTYYLNDSITTNASFSTDTLYDGKHTFKVVDFAGNTSIATFYLDLMKPELTLNKAVYGTENIVYYNLNDFVIITINENLLDLSQFLYKIDDGEFQPATSTAFKASSLFDGTYTFKIIDPLEDEASVSFIVDKLAPKISLKILDLPDYDFDANPYAQQSTRLSVNITEENQILGYRLDSPSYTSIPTINCSSLSEGTHLITVEDKAGNISEYQFHTDWTPPVISWNKSFISTPCYKFTENIIISITDINFESLSVLDGENIIFTSIYRSVTISPQNLMGGIKDFASFVLSVKDLAGNHTVLGFSVIKQQPTIELLKDSKPTAAGTFFRAIQDVSISVFAYLNKYLLYLDDEQMPYLPNSTGSLSDGTHYIKIVDSAGHEASTYFKLDTVPPVITASKNGIEVLDKFFYVTADDVFEMNSSDLYLDVFKCEDSNVINNTFFASDLDDGSYYFYAWDIAGNLTSYPVYVDKTAPLLNLIKGGSVYPDESHFNYSNSIITMTSDTKIPGLMFFDNLELKEIQVWEINKLYEGIHKFEVYDEAGNYSIITFYIDVTAPVVIFNKDGEEYSDKLYYKDGEVVNFKIEELYLNYIKVGDSIITDSFFDVESRESGTYKVEIADLAGNKVTRNIIIDKDAPTVQVKDGYSGTPLQDGLFVSSNSTLYIVFEDANADYWILDGIRYGTTPQISSLENGLHTLIGYDKAGNHTVSTFTVDKTAPVLYLYNKQKYDGVYYYNANEVVDFYYEDDNFAFVKLNGQIVTDTIKTADLQNTANELRVYDLANNYASLSFVLDRFDPDIILKKNGQELQTADVYFNALDSISISHSSDVVFVNLDGVETVLKNWTGSTLFDGAHSIYVTDAAGNYASVTFIVDKTPPVFNFNYYYNIESFADVYDIYLDEENHDIFVVDNVFYNTTVMPDIALEEGSHSLYARDKAGNTVREVFIIDKTAPSLILYKNSQKIENSFYITLNDIFSIDVSDTYLKEVLFDGEATSIRLWKSENLDEREHTITVYDSAGNYTTAHFTVDMTKPNLVLSEYYLSGEIISLDVIDATPYSISIDGSETTVNELLADSLSEGLHTVIIVDSANNIFESSFSVDLNVPILTISGYNRDGSFVESDITTSYWDLKIIVEDIAPAWLWVKKNDNDFKGYLLSELQLDATEENHGVWQFYAKDINGYSSETQTVVLNSLKPACEFEGIVTQEDDLLFTNQQFAFSKDNPFALIKYSFNSGPLLDYADNTLTIEALNSNEGVYKIYVQDPFGRLSTEYTITLSFTHNFQNLENIINSFKQSTWYTVTLPYNIFGITSKPNIAGTYSFPSAEEALTFAMEKEKEYRVVMVEDVITYVSASNENVTIRYDSYDSLNIAVKYYAQKYISERKTFSNDEDLNNYETIFSSLTANAPIRPLFIDPSIPLYMTRKEFVVSANPALSSVSATLTYIASTVGLVSPVMFNVVYEESLETLLSSHGNLYEGYYLYTERDLCGNAESAMLFIDFSEPTIQATIKRDDGTTSQVVNKDLIGIMSGVFYVSEFSIVDLFDNMDSDYIGIYISSTNFAGLFTKGDSLPILNKNLGSGLYNITIFDRSYNTLNFRVIVAGQNPTWLYSSLSAQENELTIYIYKNDQYTAFTSIELLKIYSDESFDLIEYDSEGRSVDISNTYYTITTGGKYTFVIIDIYGRTTKFDPIFFEKDMPSGLLSGVKNNGITGRAVTFSYADEFNLDIYTVVASGAKVANTEIFPIYDSPLNTYVVTFDPKLNKIIKYLLVLSSKEDPGIYLEYIFSIDAEAPTYRILVRNEDIPANSSTNSSFKITWGEESVMAFVTKDSGAQSTYSNGTLISANGLHSFVLKDSVGNESAFTVYLDSMVSYDFSKQVTKLPDNSFTTNQSIQVIVLEEFKTYSCLFGGVPLSNDSVLDQHGIYAIFIEDLYSNTIELILNIDLIAPEFTIANIEGGLTNQDVTISVDDKTASVYETSFNFENAIVSVKQNSIYTKEGTFYFKATDVAGNTTTISFTIDKKVNFTSTIENFLLTTSAVKLSFTEAVSTIATLNGELIQMNDRFEDIGNYVIEATDLANNKLTMNFTILPTRVKELQIKIPESFYVKDVTLNMSSIPVSGNELNFTTSGIYYITLKSLSTNIEYLLVQTVDSIPPEATMSEKNGVISFSNLTKTNVSAKLYKNGELIGDFLFPGSVEESGDYEIVLTDDLGNTNVYKFTVTKKMNAFTIVLICIGALVLALAVFLIIRGRFVKAS